MNTLIFLWTERNPFANKELERELRLCEVSATVEVQDQNLGLRSES